MMSGEFLGDIGWCFGWQLSRQSLSHHTIYRSSQWLLVMILLSSIVRWAISHLRIHIQPWRYFPIAFLVIEHKECVLGMIYNTRYCHAIGMACRRRFKLVHKVSGPDSGK